MFARACASCHGDHGQGGDGKSAAVGAINDPDFLALISDQALRRYMITGRPDLGMPDYADPTGRPEGFKPLTVRGSRPNVVALLAYWRQGGSVERKGELNHVALRQPDSVAGTDESGTPHVSPVVDLSRSAPWPPRSWRFRSSAICSAPCGSTGSTGSRWDRRVKFPLNETRLETFDNPLGQPWDGMAAHMGVYVRNLGRTTHRISSWSSP